MGEGSSGEGGYRQLTGSRWKGLDSHRREPPGDAGDSKKGSLREEGCGWVPLPVRGHPLAQPGLESRAPWALSVEHQTPQGAHGQDQGTSAQGHPPQRTASIIPPPATHSHIEVPTWTPLSAQASGGQSPWPRPALGSWWPSCWELRVGPCFGDSSTWHSWNWACPSSALPTLLRGTQGPASYLKTHAPFRTKVPDCAIGAHPAPCHRLRSKG